MKKKQVKCINCDTYKRRDVAYKRDNEEIRLQLEQQEKETQVSGEKTQELKNMIVILENQLLVLQTDRLKKDDIAKQFYELGVLMKDRHVQLKKILAFLAALIITFFVLTLYK